MVEVEVTKRGWYCNTNEKFDEPRITEEPVFVSEKEKGT